MDEEEPTPHAVTVICRTAGCPEEGQPNTVMLFANAAPPVYRASCAPCGQAPEITAPPE